MDSVNDSVSKDTRFPHSEIACYNGLFFFFQAEDGIRGLLVTGVQTCALPICRDERTCVDLVLWAVASGPPLDDVVLAPVVAAADIADRRDFLVSCLCRRICPGYRSSEWTAHNRDVVSLARLLSDLGISGILPNPAVCESSHLSHHASSGCAHLG